MASPLRLPTLLTGRLYPTAPLPYRPPRQHPDMAWDEIIDRHRAALAAERAARPRPWTTESLEAAIAEATTRAVRLQTGRVDLLGSGGVSLDEPARAAARWLRGVTLEPALLVPTEWVDEAARPIVKSPPALNDERLFRRTWAAAQAATTRPVKLSLPGPLSLACAFDDDVHGSDRAASVRALAAAFNPGLRALADAGCPAIEIVEPELATGDAPVDPDEIDSLGRLFHRVDQGCVRWLRLAAEDAAPPWRAALAPRAPGSWVDALNELPLNGVICPLDSPLAEPETLARLDRLRIGLVVVSADAASRDSVDRAAAMLSAVASTLDPLRLVCAIDGGWARATRPLDERLDWLEEVVRAF
ncbi:MAG: hypothetical protein AAFX81_16150 [Pseudomonadota bacterium]